ncbi:GNAT family N-acetyltransferase [Neorhodopirellula pilleata]|uniref:Putative acetyltransferase n=1 Tax=Neorhodopirellula pilleata TaxID=2714738 RepID=A0A5C6AN32_9BACT|nr:GNAT family N-acetyltransferase [Neorhodopirellula pilleata]TWU01463.1 putative acetyltransferase [Neorhodopirellula pilleata]
METDQRPATQNAGSAVFDDHTGSASRPGDYEGLMKPTTTSDFLLICDLHQPSISRAETGLKFSEIEWCTPQYQASLELRHRVLREPLGLKLTPEELDGEFGQRHFAMFDDDDAILAIVVARPKDSRRVQLRQMAVQPESQGKGIGARLLQQCEADLASHGFAEVELEARATAVAFYQKQGYEPVGEPFERISLPHQLMTKVIS